MLLLSSGCILTATVASITSVVLITVVECSNHVKIKPIVWRTWCQDWLSRGRKLGRSLAAEKLEVPGTHQGLEGKSRD